MICKKGGVKAGLEEVEANQMDNTDEIKKKLYHMVNVFNISRDNSSVVTLLQTLNNWEEYRIACHFIQTKLCGLNCNIFDYSAGACQSITLINELINLIELCGWPEYKDNLNEDELSTIKENENENENKINSIIIDNTFENKGDDDISIVCRRTIFKLLTCVTHPMIKNVADYCQFVSKLFESSSIDNQDHLVAEISNKFSDYFSTRYQLLESSVTKSE